MELKNAITSNLINDIKELSSVMQYSQGDKEKKTSKKRSSFELQASSSTDFGGEVYGFDDLVIDKSEELIMEESTTPLRIANDNFKIESIKHNEFNILKKLLAILFFIFFKMLTLFKKLYNITIKSIMYTVAYSFSPARTVLFRFASVAGLIIFLLTFVVGFLPALMSPPEIFPLNYQNSNQSIVIESRRDQFYVKQNGKYSYSTYNNSIWQVDLGKKDLEANEIQDTIEVGGIIDFGFLKLRSYSSNKYNVSRDYLAPKLVLNLAKYYTLSKGDIKITLTNKEEAFTLLFNGDIWYSNIVKDNKQICKLEVGGLSLLCPYDFGDKKKLTYDINVKDINNNKQELAKGVVVELVDENNFECYDASLYGYSAGTVVCSSNKNGVLYYQGKTVNYKANSKTNLQFDIDNSSQDVIVKMIDEHEKSQEISLTLSGVNKNLTGTVTFKNNNESVTLQAKYNNDVDLEVVKKYYYSNSKSNYNYETSIQKVNAGKISNLEIVNKSLDIPKLTSIEYKITPINGYSRLTSKTCVVNFEVFGEISRYKSSECEK